MSDGRFAGVDWASEEHAVCVVDEHGRIVEGVPESELRQFGLTRPFPGASEADHIQLA